MSGISNNEIKYLRSLSQKKFRDESGVFVVEGEKMVAEALKSGFEVEKVWREEEIGTDVMARITSLSSPSPALAVVKKPGNVRLSDGKAVSEALGLRGLFLALDTIRDPGNLGTIIRIADWFGIDGIFAEPDTVELFNPKVVRSTMGSLFRVPFYVCQHMEEEMKFMQKKGFCFYAAHLQGTKDFTKESYEGSIGILIGNEANGLSEAVSGLADCKVKIPMEGELESLNAAVSGALFMYEVRRKRR